MDTCWPINNVQTIYDLTCDLWSHFLYPFVTRHFVRNHVQCGPIWPFPFVNVFVWKIPESIFFSKCFLDKSYTYWFSIYDNNQPSFRLVLFSLTLLYALFYFLVFVGWLFNQTCKVYMHICDQLLRFVSLICAEQTGGKLLQEEMFAIIISNG